MSAAPPLGEWVITYFYEDERGRKLLKKARYAATEFRPKDFRMAARLEVGKDWRVKSRVLLEHPEWAGYFDSLLYGLPYLLDAGPSSDLAITEGEKDADALTAAGLPALSHWQGGSGWRLEQAERWRGYRGRVQIVADKDPAGARIAAQTYDLLLGVGLAPDRVRVVRAVTGKDASDHLAAGHGPDAFAPANMRRLRAYAATAPTPGPGRAYHAGRIGTPAETVLPWLSEASTAVPNRREAPPAELGFGRPVAASEACGCARAGAVS